MNCKKTKFIILLLGVVVLCSCKAFVNVVYHPKKVVQFDDLEDYKITADKKYKINTENLYYISDSAYSSFINLIITQDIDYFYGIFIDDTSKIISSPFLKENPGCRGRIISELDISSYTKTRDEIFRQFQFVNISTGKTLKFTDNGKKKLVLIFAHTAGLMMRKTFVELQKEVKRRSDYEVFIISLDPVYMYQPAKAGYQQ